MFKPLLAAKADLSAIKLPVLASPKIDGIRCLILKDHGAVTRSLKPIPNAFIREALANVPVGYDGELLTFTDGIRDELNIVQSKVMRAEGTPDFKFMVFDDFEHKGGFADRLQSVKASLHVEPVPHFRMENRDELESFERFCVEDDGWEGVMLRDPAGRYKFGKSTVGGGILLKVKRFEDDEAVVVDFAEQMENRNEAVTNALGHTERSSAKSGLFPKGTMGSLSCQWRGLTFELGVKGEKADDLWANRETLIGSLVTFKYKGTGPNGKPLIASFKSIRTDI